MPSMGLLGLGWGHRLGGDGVGGWDWWPLVGFAAVMALVLTSRRSVPIPFAIPVAALGGLILADLTHAFGVLPIWCVLILIVLSRNLHRNGGRSQV